MGKATANEAPKTFTRAIGAYTMGRPAPYAEGLQCAVPDGGTEHQDERVIGGETLGRQTVGKVADLLKGNEAPSVG